MPFSASFTGPGGMTPASHFLMIRAAVKTTVGDLLWAGQLLRTKIRRRTAEGVDVNGAAFAPYSEQYAAQKAKALGHSKVDLFGADRGVHMLNALLVKAGGRQAEEYGGNATSDSQPADSFSLGIYDEELATRARIHNEGGQIRTRLGIGSTAVGGQFPLFSSGNSRRFTGVSKKIRSAYANMPQRQFLAASNEDISGMETGIGQRMNTRLEALPK